MTSVNRNIVLRISKSILTLTKYRQVLPRFADNRSGSHRRSNKRSVTPHLLHILSVLTHSMVANSAEGSVKSLRFLVISQTCQRTLSHVLPSLYSSDSSCHDVRQVYQRCADDFSGISRVSHPSSRHRVGRAQRVAAGR